MIPGLLQLLALHEAGPGCLDVVFGPDGDFQGAPLWRGPVRLTDGRYVSMDWLLSQPWDLPIMYRMAALDPRVSGVAAKLAELCAKAMKLRGCNQRGVWTMSLHRIAELPEPARHGVALKGIGLLDPIEVIWDGEGRPVGHDGPALSYAVTGSREAALSALTLALAPKIAKLRPSCAATS
jgi:hypothetical protein